MLVVTMVILLLLQLTVAASVSSVNISSQVLFHNARATAVEREGDNLLNYLIGNKDYFINHSSYLNADSKFEIPIPDYLVARPRRASISEFICLDCPAVSASAGQNTRLSALDQTTWQLVVEVSDPLTGAVAKLTQGLRITVTTDNAASNPASPITGLRLQGVWWYSQ